MKNGNGTLAHETVVGKNPQGPAILLACEELFAMGTYGPGRSGKLECRMEVWESGDDGLPVLAMSLPAPDCPGPGEYDTMTRVQALIDDEGVVVGIHVTAECDDVLETAVRGDMSENDFTRLRDAVGEMKRSGTWRG